jgi:hypothetical protein
MVPLAALNARVSGRGTPSQHLQSISPGLVRVNVRDKSTVVQLPDQMSHHGWPHEALFLIWAKLRYAPLPTGTETLAVVDRISHQEIILVFSLDYFTTPPTSRLWGRLIGCMNSKTFGRNGGLIYIQQHLLGGWGKPHDTPQLGQLMSQRTFEHHPNKRRAQLLPVYQPVRWEDTYRNATDS